MSEQRARHVLVLAPHPDDETFGCGGTIRMLTESGIAVDVAFMTRGELGADEGLGSSPQQRREVASRVGRKLGVAPDREAGLPKDST